MIGFHSNPRGDAYDRLLDYVGERAAMFVVRLHPKMRLTHTMEVVLERLSPYFKYKKSFHQLRDKRSSFAYTKGNYYFYTSCPEAVALLQESARSMYAWQHPALPEDLSFLHEDGSPLLITIAHEEMLSLVIGEEEAEELSAEVPGLFMMLAAHQDLDHYLDDAIRHQTDKLDISGYGVTDLPERLSSLRGCLKQLHLFEHRVRRLPPVLFELTSLESLTIYTYDLEELPADISKLSNLRHLTLYCGSCIQIEPGLMQMIPAEQISLRELPPELGQLHQLETLDISYTAISELPPELEQLQRLRSLSMSGNQLKERPAFLDRMPSLTYVSI